MGCPGGVAVSPGGAGGAGGVRVQAQLVQGLVQAAEPGADGRVAACLLQVPHVLAQQCSHIVDTEVLQRAGVQVGEGVDVHGDVGLGQALQLLCGGTAEVGAHEVVVGGSGPGAAEGLSGLEEELVLPALRAGGGIQGPGQPGEGRLMGRRGALRLRWAGPGPLSLNRSYPFALSAGLIVSPQNLYPPQTSECDLIWKEALSYV